jgi:Cytochrome oxidase c subunit VIb
MISPLPRGLQNKRPATPLTHQPYLSHSMGWFGSSKAEKPNAISREDRSKCWEARDAYFSCLDSAEVVVPGTEGSKCASQRNTFEQNCAKSWVCLSLYLSLHVIIFLHRILNMALRSTTSISVAYWRRSRSHCLPKQRLRLLEQEGHDKGLHHSSLAFEASFPRMCVTFFVFVALDSEGTTRQHRPTRILNTPIIFSSYVSV